MKQEEGRDGEEASIKAHEKSGEAAEEYGGQEEGRSEGSGWVST